MRQSSDRYSGYVDSWDGREICGWACVMDDLAAKPDVFLLADGCLVDHVVPVIHRPDVDDLLGWNKNYGFVIPVNELIAKYASRLDVVFETGKTIENGSIILQENKGNHIDIQFNSITQEGIIFLHIQKCGGTSLRNIIDTVALGKKSVFFYPLPPGIYYDTLEKMSVVQKAKIELYYGHLYYGLHNLLPGHWRYATVLRDPIARVVSNYFHHRKNGMELPPLKDAICRPCLAEFDNYIVRLLAGESEATVPLGEVKYDTVYRALEHVARDFSFIGFLEDGPAMVNELVHLFDGKSVELPYDNKGDYDGLSEVSSDDLAAIREKNRFDVALYNILRNNSLK